MTSGIGVAVDGIGVAVGDDVAVSGTGVVVGGGGVTVGSGVAVGGGKVAAGVATGSGVGPQPTSRTVNTETNTTHFVISVGSVFRMNGLFFYLLDDNRAMRDERGNRAQCC
jgi:hypothetical protein